MTHTEALQKALAALHEIGGAITTRQLLAKPVMNPVLRRKLEEKTKSDHDIAKLALDVWEEIVFHVEPRLPGTTIFECAPSEHDGE